MTAPLGRTIDVKTITGSTPDVDGNPVPVETTTTVVGHWRQLSSDELGADEIGRTVFRVYLPIDTTVDADSRLVLGADVTEVAGSPQTLYNPRTRLPEMIVCRAKVTQ